MFITSPSVKTQIIKQIQKAVIPQVQLKTVIDTKRQPAGDGKLVDKMFKTSIVEQIDSESSSQEAKSLDYGSVEKA